MTKPKTLEQLRAEKERAETQLAQEQHKLERLENTGDGFHGIGKQCGFLYGQGVPPLFEQVELPLQRFDLLAELFGIRCRLQVFTGVWGRLRMAVLHKHYIYPLSGCNTCKCMKHSVISCTAEINCCQSADNFRQIKSKCHNNNLHIDRKSTRLNSSHSGESRMPSSA